MLKKHLPLYREIICQAWGFTWRERSLWVLGIFSALIVTGGALEIFSRNLQWVFNPRRLMWPFNRFTLAHLDLAGTELLIIFCLLILALLIFFIFMSVKSFISLIVVTAQGYSGERINLAKMWQASQKNFWPVFGIVVLFKILIFLFSLLNILPLWLIWGGQAGLAWVCFYPLLFLITVTASLVCSFLMVLTAAYVVIEKRIISKAIGLGWRLFTKHWLVSLEMALIIFVVNFLLGLLAVAGTFIVGLPVLLAALFAFFVSLPILAKAAFFVGFLLISVLILGVAGFLGAFHVIAWTLLFKRMTEGSAVSKLHRLTQGLWRKIFKR